MLVVSRRHAVARVAFYSTKKSRGIDGASSKKKPPKPDDIVVDPVIFLRLKRQIIQRHKSHSAELNGLPQTDVFNKYILDVRKGLDKNDILLIRRTWEDLRRINHLPLLTPDIIQQISKFTAKSLLPGDADNKTWDESSKSFVEEVALAAAVHSTDALNTCLLAYIKRRDPTAVLELYEKFKLLPQPKEDALPDILSGDNITLQRSQSPPGRVNVQHAVTTAYAMQDSFQGALNAYLDADTSFPHNTTEAFLQTISHDPSLLDKTRTFIQRLEVAKKVARAPSLSKHIHSLSMQPASPLLEKLYRSILDGMNGPEAYIAPDPEFISSTKLVAMTEFIWASFLAAFLRRDRKDLAANLWKDMTQLGVQPGTLTWNMVLDVYSDRRATKEALAAWDTMISHGVKPDGFTYRAVISSLFAGKRLEDALRWFMTFEKEAKLTSSEEQTRAVYNTTLHGLFHAGRDNAKTAFSLLKKMETIGPKPDLVSYNTVLTYHGRQGDFKSMAAIINSMSLAKIPGDVFTFSTILSAMLKAGREDAPDMILNLMRKQGVEASVATYSAIIHQQMAEQNVKNLQAAMRLLEEMENDAAAQPNEITYTSILTGLYRGKWLPPGQAEIYRRDIIARMEKRRIKFKSWGYSIIIKACLESEDPRGLEDALKFYREMPRVGVLPTEDTWYILLAGLSRRGEWQLADEVVSDLLASSANPPKGTVLRLINTIRQHPQR